MIFEKLAKKYKTPKQVQEYLRTLPYNREKKGSTLRSAASAVKAGQAHCFEAAFVAAAILECHGYPPLVMSFESIDGLDHVLFVYQQKGKWGAVGRSRDEGLHGRPAVYRSLRDLALSYYEPYIDKTGRITAFQLADLDETNADWRYAKRFVWPSEQYLLDLPHQKLITSHKKFRQIKKRYLKNGPMKAKSFWW